MWVERRAQSVAGTADIAARGPEGDVQHQATPGITMQANDELLSRLRAHIGRRLQLAGRPWRIVEVLAADGRLVLESQEPEPPIQPDQYGNAAYRAPEHLEVALLTAKGEPSPNLERLLQALEAQRGDPAPPAT
jgi:hypothetical protein